MDHPYQQRLDTFRQRLTENGLEGAVVAWPPHVFYLSGLHSGPIMPVFLLVDQSQSVAVAPQGMVANTDENLYNLTPYTDFSIYELVSPRHKAAVALENAMVRLGFTNRRIGIEQDRLGGPELKVLAQASTKVDVEAILSEMRFCKDATEIQRIRTNAGVLEAAFDAARDAIRPGITELEIWTTMYGAMAGGVGRPFHLIGNLASGPRTLEDEPQASDRVVEAGDLVFIDLYPTIDGYCADLTRTFVVGAPTPAQYAQHSILQEALEVACAALRPGIRACEVDHIVRSTITAAGYGDYFPHHSGHGIGLIGQESPFLIPGDETPLRAGNVVAIEPGIYHPEVGGMRLEGNYVITERGYEPLTEYPFQLIACE